MSQQSNLTLLNLPTNPPSHPDTPSEMPGTPTSTTTSLSALSTTAIKDGQRGHHHHPAAGQRGHQHNLSTNSLEAERADRISRLPGFSAVQTTQRSPATPGHSSSAQNARSSPQTTPTSTGFPAHGSGMPVTAITAPGGLTPAFFDAAGQPVAQTKMSTVGTASATESVAGHTQTETETGGDHDMLGAEDADEDMQSMDTNFRSGPGEMDDNGSGYLGPDAMDEDLASRSVGGYEDRMSDDGSASLVGFGEGAGSTVSGPIYHRRPLPGSSAGAMERVVWGLERSSSGLSEGAMLAAGGPSARRDTVRGPPEQGVLLTPNLSQGQLSAQAQAQAQQASGAGDRDTPVTYNAAVERREARLVDGVALDGPAAAAAVAGGVANDDMFLDTTTRGPMAVQPPTSALRETQRPDSQYVLQQRQQQQPRETVERIVRDRLDHGEERVATGGATLGSPTGKERLGKFYFEERK